MIKKGALIWLLFNYPHRKKLPQWRCGGGKYLLLKAREEVHKFAGEDEGDNSKISKGWIKLHTVVNG
jgi:hypothetical protein